ncbi:MULTISPECIES: hypothetical protein [Nostoc]|uniref:DUF2029 domain-containing protein n=1 Tax=Nostoc paludosum FACHB-159 TaxID=2692908 RepID=A0ABR8KIG2_9NOSO|nr:MULTISPECIES: hypothetical protein [Nostoc]MBD2683011.1 hypothetical protein [Nostoc sp. FACHB-857]MBD2739352.1 hypothetical protein [Nostoc paludosum FACHB-159]
METNRAISSHHPSGRRLLYVHIIMFVLAFLVIISRRPDAILNPQFWAEDGTVFYAQAYNDGSLNSLFLPYAGYLHALPRLTAAFSMLFPFKLAPLIFNLIAIIIQILPVTFLISSRFSKLIPNINYGICISFLYLALPGCYEVNANITNTQWRIALLIFMAMIAQSSQVLVNLFDLIIILIGGLTGPFSILIMPIIVFLIFSKKIKNKKMTDLFYFKFVVLICTAFTQFIVLNSNQIGQARLSKAGSIFLSFDDVKRILQILTNQVFSISIFGTKITNYFINVLPDFLYNILNIIILIAGIIALLYLLLKSPLELRAFILFAALIPFTAIALMFPNITVFEPVGVGARYWFNSVLAFSLGTIWLCYKAYTQKNYIGKVFALTILATLSIGIVTDWQHPPFTDFKFASYADKFVELPAGQEIIIPTNPAPWSIKLIKH